jgi:hypothetical protein
VKTRRNAGPATLNIWLTLSKLINRTLPRVGRRRDQGKLNVWTQIKTAGGGIIATGFIFGIISLNLVGRFDWPWLAFWWVPIVAIFTAVGGFIGAGGWIGECIHRRRVSAKRSQIVSN